MNINIPDKVYKVLILVGFIIIGYSFYQIDKTEEKYFNHIDNYDELRDSLSLMNLLVIKEEEQIIRKAEILSLKYQRENPIKSTDSILSFDIKFQGDNKQLELNDSLLKLWDNYRDKKSKYEYLQKKVNLRGEFLDKEERYKNRVDENHNMFLYFGLFAFIGGFFLWLYDDYQSSGIIVTNIKQQDIIFRYCQSCGKRFSSMLAYGTNKDKTENYSFCCQCYKKGKFLEPDLTQEDLLTRALNKNHSWRYKRLIKKRIKGLTRWTKKEY